MAKILIIRFSAIGDVAMSIPVIDSFARQYPQYQIMVLSRSNMAHLFDYLPPNVVFRGVDIKNNYKGLSGLNRLYNELKDETFEYVADFHDVIRSKFLRWRFKLNGKKIAHIDKGRKGKKELVRIKNKKKIQQPTSFQRYADVLEQLGFPVKIDFRSIFQQGKGDLSAFSSIIEEKGNNRWIGIAPFAAHVGKIYPLEKMEKVVSLLAAHPNFRVFLFGGGKNEIEILRTWSNKYPSVNCIAGLFTMKEELALMSHLDLMVSMDSGNMHLASLVGTPVISIWGATHPFAGFMGWHQSENNAIQENLPCRPCSIYGKKPCIRGDYACLNQIQPQNVLQHILHLLK